MNVGAMSENVTINGADYRRIDGFERSEGRDPCTVPAVPGVGPVLQVVSCDGTIHATRSDGHEPVEYQLFEDGWRRVER